MKKTLTTFTLLLLVMAFITGCSPGGTTTAATSLTTTMASKATDTAMTTASTQATSAMSITYQDLSPMEAKALIDKTPDLIIIDVSPKYAEGHLPRAINYYLGDGSLDKAIPTLDKRKIFLVYCHVDSVSIAGAQKLIDAGFENVYRLKGNYAAWVEAGYAVEK